MLSAIVAFRETQSSRQPAQDEVDMPGIQALQMQEEETQPKSGQFQMKRLIVAGMMDITLLASNANQLKYILAHQTTSSSTVASAVLIGLSIFLQICSGVGFIFKKSFSVTRGSSMATLDITLTVFVFLITVINVIASVFAPVVATTPLQQ